MKIFLTFATLLAVACANPLNTWSLADLLEAVNSPHTNPEFLPYLQFALSELKNTIANGLEVEGIVLPTPAVIEGDSAPSVWTVHSLSAALQNPHTNPAYIPYLETGLNDLLTALFTGQSVNSIVINLPAEPMEIIPIPIFPQPEPESPEAEIMPIPIPTPEPPVVSPLVQIIVNIKGQKTQITEFPNDPFENLRY